MRCLHRLPARLLFQPVARAAGIARCCPRHPVVLRAVPGNRRRGVHQSRDGLYRPLRFRTQPLRCPAGGGTQDGDTAVEDRCQKERENRSKAQAADDHPTDGNAQSLRPN